MAPTQPTAFGALVKRIREQRGYSQGQVTERGGLASGHLAMIETGLRGKRVGRDMVLRIAEGLRATGDERDELLRLAGHVPDGDQPAPLSYTDAVNTDPRLRSDQKRVLLDLYATMVRARA